MTGTWPTEDALEGIGPRIREARGSMSQQQLAARLGVHCNTIGKLERGMAIPDARVLIELGAATRVSPAWLLMGNRYDKQIESPELGPALPAEPADWVLVPGYEVKSGASDDFGLADQLPVGRFAFQRTWLERRGLNPQHFAVVNVRGDSMEPTVRSGDTLLVNRSVTRFSTDGVYLIERGEDLYCKRLQRLFDGGVMITSDNARYEAQHLTEKAAEALRVVGRVVWIGGAR